MGMLFYFVFCTEMKEVIEYVNPFIGTEQVGHTYPGAGPFRGMVQLSRYPDRRLVGLFRVSIHRYPAIRFFPYSHERNGRG